MHLTAQWKEFSKYTLQAMYLELITTYFFIIFRCACSRLCRADQNMFVSGKICHRWVSLFLYLLKLFLQEEAQFSWYQQVQPDAYDRVTCLLCRSRKSHKYTETQGHILSTGCGHITPLASPLPAIHLGKKASLKDQDLPPTSHAL